LNTYANTAYTYSAAGELVSATTNGQSTAYQYDAFGNLLGVTRPDATRIGYLLDGQNRRVGKTVNGVLVQGFLFQDGLRLVAEVDAAGAIVSRFVYGTDSNAPDYFIKNGSTYRIIADQVGSIRLVVDSTTGQIVQRLDYDEFGNVLQDSNPGFQPFGFAGGLYDRDTGLVHFGAREYDPSTGRWTTPDPLRFNGGDTNLYAYVQNDPIDMVDPMGLDATCQKHYNISTHQWDVTINLNIEYGGFGFDPAMVNAWNNAISSTWSGTFGEYHVTTTVGTGSDNFLVWIWPGADRATTMQERRGTTIVDAWGNWYAQGSGIRARRQARSPRTRPATCSVSPIGTPMTRTGTPTRIPAGRTTSWQIRPSSPPRTTSQES
jgi:RHS repeat-associated protein